jgi:hypothetical protein
LFIQPYAAHAGGGDYEPALPQLVGNADLAEGRLLDRRHYDGSLLRHAVLQHRLLAVDFLRGQFAALLVEVAHHFAGLADIAKLLGELQQANLGADHRRRDHPAPREKNEDVRNRETRRCSTM